MEERIKNSLIKLCESWKDSYITWYDFVDIITESDIDYEEIKELFISYEIYPWRIFPGTRIVLSNLRSIIDYYKLGFSLYDISVYYGVGRSTLNSVLSYLNLLRPNSNEFSSKNLSYHIRAKNLEWIEYRNSDKYKSLGSLIESLVESKNIYIEFPCACCGHKIKKTLSEWKEYFKSNWTPPHCGDYRCTGFLIKLTLGFPDDVFKKYRKLLYYHSEGFKKILINHLNDYSKSINDISLIYGFSWKFILYHLIPFFNIELDNYERKSLVRSYKLSNNLIYNPFKDPIWQLNNSSRSEYNSYFGYNGWYYSRKMNREYHYRSTWELEAYEALDWNNKVSSYIVEPFSIEYEFEGIKRNYIPDILVKYFDGSISLIEIKPSSLVENEINIAKFEAAKRYCSSKGYNWKVLTELNWNYICE